jgi:hypothetical protein
LIADDLGDLPISLVLLLLAIDLIIDMDEGFIFLIYPFLLTDENFHFTISIGSLELLELLRFFQILSIAIILIFKILIFLELSVIAPI